MWALRMILCPRRKGVGSGVFFGRAWIGSYRAGYTAESKRHRGKGLHPYTCTVLGALVSLLGAFAIGGVIGV